LQWQLFDVNDLKEYEIQITYKICILVLKVILLYLKNHDYSNTRINFKIYTTTQISLKLFELLTYL
jgi:hypothetical protein